MREIIRTEGIVKRYENYFALNGVDFVAHERRSSASSGTTAQARPP